MPQYGLSVGGATCMMDAPLILVGASAMSMKPNTSELLGSSTLRPCPPLLQAARSQSAINAGTIQNRFIINPPLRETSENLVQPRERGKGLPRLVVNFLTRMAVCVGNFPHMPDEASQILRPRYFVPDTASQIGRLT